MQYIERLIQLFFNGSYQEPIKKNFFDWLLDNKHIGAKEEALFNLWNNLEVAPDFMTEEAFKRTRYKIKQLEQQKNKKNKLRFAAILVAAVLPLLLYIYWDKKDIEFTESIEMKECFVPYGETKTLLLADSTRVTLFAGSLLVYPNKFTNNHRKVYLSGEANFEVNKQESVFIVKTNDMDVEVLGTVFKISSYPESEDISTTLEQGQVQVCINNNKLQAKPIVLAINQQLNYNRLTGTIILKSVNAQQVMAENQTSLFFTHVSLNQLIRVIERKYGVKVHLLTTKFIKERVTAKFVKDESLEESLAIIKELIPSLNYKIENKEVWIN